ncbi:TIGR03016 family PEP-CTERM system-associated outer membrane protein [Rhodoferax sp. 4810]|uniref:TIGR03016 family PEP-CTERM system-associated outer membrane protein n=1 Tax=Thiospirillum jenense TaxID=1653858 RepID=A0A839HGT7_9GAMM|nr:TIGR03016 family PEP-CTERM system-associated outer membrane protein [Rhodoferax jenense]MBB1127180.1 TIGR03016 family PEP-CTERM system-associated outer membrane protein [Thiospirillum jenense]
MTKAILFVYLGVLLSCVAPLTNAGEWQLTRQVNLETVYTDNLFLTIAPSTQQKQQDAFIVSLTPGIVLTGKGKNAELDLAYSTQYLRYSTADIDPQLYHHLQANSHFELVAEHLFLDAHTSAGQSQINTQAISGADASSPTGNVQNVYMYSISPSYKSRLKQWLELSLQFETNGVIYTDGDQLAKDDMSPVNQLAPTKDSHANRGSLELGSGPILNDAAIGLQLETEKQNTDNSQFNSANLLYGQQLNTHWRYDSLIGYEDNDYATSDVTDETHGLEWETSTTWMPSSRTSLKVGVNGHYFGIAPLLEWEHQQQRSNWTASFVRTLTTTHNEQLKSKAFQFTNGLGEQMTPNTSDPNFLSSNQLQTSDNQVFVANNFNTSYALQSGRNLFDIALNYSVRASTSDQQESKTWRGSLTWTRRLNTKTALNLALDWDQISETNSFTESTTNVLNNETSDRTTRHAEIGFVRQLTRHTGVGLSYGLRKDTEYTENRIMLGLQSQWDR